MQYNNQYTKDETKELLFRVKQWIHPEDTVGSDEQDPDEQLELDILMNPSGKVQAVFYDWRKDLQYL